MHYQQPSGGLPPLTTTTLLPDDSGGSSSRACGHGVGAHWPGTRRRVVSLVDFQMKFTTAAQVTFNAPEGAHDDLVLSMELAAWWGERWPIVHFW
jgi:hypothetical protein